MSDTTQTLQLPGARLESIEQSDNEIKLNFSLFYLVQEIENSIDSSLWTQAGNLVVRDITIEGELPVCPCEIKGGDLTNNIYTYRDHAPLPIDWRGVVACKFTIAGSDSTFSINGESMQLEQINHPRYIKHIKKN